MDAMTQLVSIFLSMTVLCEMIFIGKQTVKGIIWIVRIYTKLQNYSEDVDENLEL